MKKFITLLMGFLMSFTTVAHAGRATEYFCREHPEASVCEDRESETPEEAVAEARTERQPSGWRELAEMRSGREPRTESVREPSSRETDPPVIVTQAYDTPWSGGHTDPLVAMLDIASEADINWCVPNPAHISPDMIRVENRTAFPGRIQVDGRNVTVFNATQKVDTAIVVDAGNQRRYSVLQPGHSCYLEAPYKHPTIARRDGFKVTFIQAYSKGASGYPINLEYSSLWSVRTFRGRAVTRTLKRRPGGVGMSTRFDHLDGF